SSAAAASAIVEFYFVRSEEAQQLIDAAPDVEWRLIVALCRHGGLRCPSEVLSLKWEHIDWEHARVTVPSPKTAHHAGMASRVIPLFPELRPYLEDPQELSGNSEYCITWYHDRNTNLRTGIRRIAANGGVKMWPKPFQNMRSTRETELASEFPQHVACRWLGNSQSAATKHYLPLTDEHFAKATGVRPDAPKIAPPAAPLRSVLASQSAWADGPKPRAFS
ncbi:MAG: site-specific integrase, partial [Planctomycetales bacterium]|nr:site-specific integrase [Planctomycetales bacterium]